VRGPYGWAVAGLLFTAAFFAAVGIVGVASARLLKGWGPPLGVPIPLRAIQVKPDPGAAAATLPPPSRSSALRRLEAEPPKPAGPRRTVPGRCARWPGPQAGRAG
jgi:hypothetical protein